MASANAAAVAHEVIEKVRKGEKVAISKIALKHGYKPSVAKKPNKITNTRAYQEAISPLLQEIDEARMRAIRLLKKREAKANYRDLVYGADVLTKNHQLLSGKSTSNVAIAIRELDDADLQNIAAGSEAGAS